MSNAVSVASLIPLSVPYGYSFDRETFRGEFPTREQALEAGLRAAAKLSGVVDAVYVGKRVAVDPQADHHAEDVVRNMRRRMLAKTGEASYLASANEHVMADLDVALERTIKAWLDKHELAPAARVSSISEHPLPAVRAHAPGRHDEVQLMGPEQ